MANGKWRIVRTLSIRYFATSLLRYSADAAANLDFRFERAVDRTLLGDLEQPRADFIVQRARNHDLLVDPVQHPFLGFARLAVGGVDLGVGEPHRDPFERQALAV